MRVAVDIFLMFLLSSISNCVLCMQMELGPSVDCRTEADIFNALGLAYVPPHMRFFGPNFE